MGGFMQFTESDSGSKDRAKKRAKRFSEQLTVEGRWRLKAWWYEVWMTARMYCLAWAFDTGTLFSTIRIEESRSMPEGYPYEVAFSSQNEMVNSMIIAGGYAINPKSGRIVDYAQFVHDGHFTVGGRWMPPKPFLRQAIEDHRAELDMILKNCIEKVAETEWAGD